MVSRPHFFPTKICRHPVEARLQKVGETRRSAIQDALKFQWQAVECWQNELNARFDAGLRALAVTEIRLD